MADPQTPPPVESLADARGGTPLVQLRRCLPPLPAVELYAKLQWLDPESAIHPLAIVDMPNLARELREQTCGRLTHLMVPVDGTGNELLRNLLSHLPSVALVAVTAGTTCPAPIADPAIERMTVDPDEARSWAARMALEEGLRGGPASGAAAVAALRVARRQVAAGRTAWIVLLCPDQPVPMTTAPISTGHPPAPW